MKSGNGEARIASSFTPDQAVIYSVLSMEPVVTVGSVEEAGRGYALFQIQLTYP